MAFLSASTDSNLSEQKRIILIRHGLSYMNEHIGANGITFGGPDFTDIFSKEDHEKFYRDSPLSQTGLTQAKELGKAIEALRKEPDNSNAIKDLNLVVVSPLTRAIQTGQFALFPHLDQIRDPSSIPIIALPLAAERLYLVSDIGRPKAELESKYRDLGIDFRTAFPTEGDDSWWYQGDSAQQEEWRPIGQGQEYFCPGEPFDAFQQRMLDLCDWLDQRPETNIALVGHFGVFEWLLQDQDASQVKFSNCEVRVVPFRTILANARRRRG